MASGFTQLSNKVQWPRVLYNKPFVKWTRNGDELNWDFDRTIVWGEALSYLRKVIEGNGFSGILQLDMTNLFLQRPRVLKFDDVDFGLLENIDLRLQPQDYVQPFQTVLLDLPKAYQESRISVDAAFDEESHPLFVATTWRPELSMLSLSIYLSTMSVYSVMFGNGEQDLESQLSGIGHTFVGSLPISDEERVIYNKIIRAALNASLYGMHVGLDVQPENPSYFRRLQQAQGASSPHTDAWRRFKTHPFIYTPRVKVEAKTGKYVERASTGGWTVTPHRRRAHWRMQRCGVGLTETRRLLIPSVIVNEEALRDQS